MDRLHAYWRVEYVRAQKDGSNHIFEEITLGDDEENNIVVRGESCYLVLNKYPYNAGHLLAIPYRKVDSLCKLSESERSELINLVAFAEDLLRKAFEPNGFNIGINVGSASGAGIPNHLHIHIVPRWNGDTNFMPVIGDVKVLSSGLNSVWKRLREFL